MAARKLVAKLPGALADISEEQYHIELRGLHAGAGSNYVCQLLAASATSTPGHFTFLLEYCSKGTLARLLTAITNTLRQPGMLLSAEVMANMGAGLLLGLRHLHAKGCVHRDLKPDNIFISGEGRAIVGDLDNCEFLDESGAVYGMAGTYPYAAPEVPQSPVALKDLKKIPYSTPADLYSLGVVLSECAMGCDWITWRGYLSGICREVPSYVPATLVSLLEGLLERDPEKRLTVEAAMRHPFFAGVDFDDEN